MEVSANSSLEMVGRYRACHDAVDKVGRRGTKLGP